MISFHLYPPTPTPKVRNFNCSISKAAHLFTILFHSMFGYRLGGIYSKLIYLSIDNSKSTSILCSFGKKKSSYNVFLICSEIYKKFLTHRFYMLRKTQLCQERAFCILYKIKPLDCMFPLFNKM